MNRTRTGLFNDRQRIDAHIIGLALMVGLLLPHEGWLYFVNPALILVLAFRYSKIRQLRGTKLFIIFGMLLSAVGYVFFENQTSQKEFLRAIVLIQMIALFPFVKSSRIPDGYLYFGMGFIMLSQLMYVVGFTPLVSFFGTLYPYTGEHKFYQSDFLLESMPEISIIHGTIRLGGMFHNPNEYAKQLNFIFAVFLIENRKSYSFKVVISVVVLISLLYAGSRTGSVVFALIFTAFSFLEYRQRPSASRMVIVYFIVAAIGVSVHVLRELYLSRSVRSLDIEGGLEDSIYLKWSFLKAYLETYLGFWQILFGTFDISLVEQYTKRAKLMDSEWGNAIFAYGLVFVIGIVAFFVRIFRTIPQSTKLMFILLLWMVSATLLFSYRSSFVLLLLLSKYYAQGILERKSDKSSFELGQN